jgi:1-deoxy-D-xylulose-5-phosphate reductoisomerase
VLKYISSIPAGEKQPPFPRRLTILGSTGSIGRSTLSVVSGQPGMFSISGLAAGRNIRLLVDQALAFRPPLLAVLDETLAGQVRSMLPADYTPEILSGPEGYVLMAGSSDADIVVSAQVGAAGLAPTLAAIRAGLWVGLANKESLVLAGGLIRKECSRHGAVILPVDSEHNALFQCIAGHDAREVTALHLTASGGPFRELGADELARVTPDQALSHPNWSMGPKITVDSATMMNKGLEVIEAHHLFGLGLESIRVLIHPQSIIHSMAEFCDGSFLAHLGVPDMRIPIGFCLSYPRRMDLGMPALELARIGSLRFEEPDEGRFPCLALARQALLAGPSHPVVLNAANEMAVELFLQGVICFTDIPVLVRRALDEHAPMDVKELQPIFELDNRTRERVKIWALDRNRKGL